MASIIDWMQAQRESGLGEEFTPMGDWLAQQNAPATPTPQFLNMGQDYANMDTGKTFNKPLYGINPTTGQPGQVYIDYGNPEEFDPLSSAAKGYYFQGDPNMPSTAQAGLAGGYSYPGKATWDEKGVIAGLAAMTGGAFGPALGAAAGVGAGAGTGAVAGATGAGMASNWDPQKTLQGGALGGVGGYVGGAMAPAAQGALGDVGGAAATGAATGAAKAALTGGSIGGAALSGAAGGGTGNALGGAFSGMGSGGISSGFDGPQDLGPGNNILGSAGGNDMLANVNDISGGSGNNTMLGGGGNDLLKGGNMDFSDLDWNFDDGSGQSNPMDEGTYGTSGIGTAEAPSPSNPTPNSDGGAMDMYGSQASPNGEGGSGTVFDGTQGSGIPGLDKLLGLFKSGNTLGGAVPQGVMGKGGLMSQNPNMMGGIGSILEMMNQRKYQSDLTGVMNNAVNKADPFSAQRPQYQQQFNQMNSDPSWMQNDSVLKGIQDQAYRNVASSDYAKGYGGSGNLTQDLMRTGVETAAPYALQRMQQVGQAAGAFNGPGYAGTLAGNLGGQAAQAGLAGNGAIGSLLQYMGGGPQQQSQQQPKVNGNGPV